MTWQDVAVIGISVTAILVLCILATIIYVMRKDI